jgi:hypothetical protein
MGFGQYGKGKDYLGSALVYKKFNTRTFVWIPLLSKIKEGLIIFF